MPKAINVVSFLPKEIHKIDFDVLQAIGHGIAGSPATVRDSIARLECEAGVNDVLCQTMFGDMNFSDATHSINLFGQEVMRSFGELSCHTPRRRGIQRLHTFEPKKVLDRPPADDDGASGDTRANRATTGAPGRDLSS